MHALLGVRRRGGEHVRVVDEAALASASAAKSRGGKFVREIVMKVLALRIAGARERRLEEDPVPRQQAFDVGEDVADVRSTSGAELPATRVEAVSTGDETT